MGRRTIDFTKDAEDAIEKYRKAKSPIPTINDAVNELVVRGVKAA